MNKKELKKLAKGFIMDSKRDLPKEIGTILVKRGVKTIKSGDPILLGEFERLPKRKRERIKEIAKKMVTFFEEKKCLFNMSDIISLTEFNKMLENKIKEVKD